ncbi:hypothetical protein M3P19_00990 [Muricauda sp. 2012CJ35-5]|uniref:Uncharacterized protein n=1 Tax=Flagellimonas spongiicola TaxID=2942208 RepID=A0ABT0PME1_9FLAO|nr:hypothetical protein [Allomuricauda spongiicola]MCL6272560.1 hypothetical protein [Allomuricauda spongiicola]
MIKSFLEDRHNTQIHKIPADEWSYTPTDGPAHLSVYGSTHRFPLL